MTPMPHTAGGSPALTSLDTPRRAAGRGNAGRGSAGRGAAGVAAALAVTGAATIVSIAPARAAAAPAAPPAVPRVAVPAASSCPPPSNATAPSKITSAERSTILRLHNQARAEITIPPALTGLTWDAGLANAAQGWADIIGPSKHSECHSGSWSSGQGENIADFGTVEQGVRFWYDEKSSYHYPAPVASGGAYLHYTQMVWRDTRRIGCGKAPSPKYYPTNIVLVCRYSPAGNVFGRAPY